MGKHRKHHRRSSSPSTRKLLKKLKDQVDQLQKERRSRSHRHSSSSDSTSSHLSRSLSREVSRDRSPRGATRSRETERGRSTAKMSVSGRRSPTVSLSPHRRRSLSVLSGGNLGQRSPRDNADVLTLHASPDRDLNSALGESTNSKEQIGGEIQVDLSTRWVEIIQSGLSKEEKAIISQRYPVPGNCLLLAPPKVNKEITAIMGETAKKKDRYQSDFQQQVCLSVTALSGALTDLSKNGFNNRTKEGKVDLLMKLTDAGKLMTDLHHSLSLSRRAFITPILSYQNKLVADASPVDELLYGGDFSERVKAATEISKTADSLKRKPVPQQKVTKKVITPKPATREPGYFQYQNQPKKSLNYRRPSQPKYRESRRGRRQSRSPLKNRGQRSRR